MDERHTAREKRGKEEREREKEREQNILLINLYNCGHILSRKTYVVNRQIYIMHMLFLFL